MIDQHTTRRGQGPLLHEIDMRRRGCPSSVSLPFEIDVRRRDDPSSVFVPFEIDARRADDPSSVSVSFEIDALLHLPSLRNRRPLLRLLSLRKPFSKLRGGETLPTVFLSAVARRFLPPRDLPAQFQCVST